MPRSALKVRHPHIVSRKGYCGGSPVIAGTKFPVRSSVNYVLRQGMTPEELVAEFHPRGGLSDPEQLAFAVKQRRAFLTHNIRDFVLLEREYRAKGQTHYGILVCDQVPFRELLRRTLRCLDRKSEAAIRNQVVWLQDFKEQVPRRDHRAK